MLRRLPLFVISIYQKYISPVLPSRCRYLPTCSQYARECFETHPLHRACYLSIKRILSCNPWNHGGYDPVPHQSKHSSNEQ